MRGMIYAVSPDGVIGKDNAIPWRHPGDLKRFKRMTMGAVVVMGRNTYDEVGKPLPGRRNIVAVGHRYRHVGRSRARRQRRREENGYRSNI